MSDSLPHCGLQHARLPCPSPISRACSNSCPSSQWSHTTISSSVSPFSSCPQSFPASGSFPMSQLLASGSQSIGASASVLHMNIQDWFPLELTGLVSLQFKGPWRVFSSATIQKHQFFSSQLSLWSSAHIHRRRQWQPTPSLLPGKSHGWRSLVGCSPWGHEELDMTEGLHFHFSLSCIGEGNGNPLQCSCLENPRDGGDWWAAVYGVAQSRTRLKRLSSSSSSHPYMTTGKTIALTRQTFVSKVMSLLFNILCRFFQGASIF